MNAPQSQERTFGVLVEPRVYGRGPYPPAATPEDAIAREAVARIAEEEGFRSAAEFRRRGAYDGDTEHQIALMAIRLFTQGPGVAEQASPVVRS